MPEVHSENECSACHQYVKSVGSDYCGNCELLDDKQRAEVAKHYQAGPPKSRTEQIIAQQAQEIERLRAQVSGGGKKPGKSRDADD